MPDHFCRLRMSRLGCHNIKSEKSAHLRVENVSNVLSQTLVRSSPDNAPAASTPLVFQSCSTCSPITIGTATGPTPGESDQQTSPDQTGEPTPDTSPTIDSHKEPPVSKSTAPDYGPYANGTSNHTITNDTASGSLHSPSIQALSGASEVQPLSWILALLSMALAMGLFV